MNVKNFSCVRVDFKEGGFFQVDHINMVHISPKLLNELNVTLNAMKTALDRKYAEKPKGTVKPSLGINVQDTLNSEDVPHG